LDETPSGDYTEAMGSPEKKRAYPKADALLLLYGILMGGYELDRDYYLHATGISPRSFRRYISECRKWAKRFAPKKRLVSGKIADGDVIYELVDEGSEPQGRPFKHYGQMSWGMKNSDGC
jgi:hypothetical protein